MVSSRTVTATFGVAVSLAVSAVLWWQFDTFLFFLVVPFVPFLFDRDDRDTKECPVCGFRARSEEYDYCPRDGHRLD
jgi:hypothetical protein